MIDIVQRLSRALTPGAIPNGWHGEIQARCVRRLSCFLRGTCHLFYERLPQQALLDDAPPVWICGDMHLENFGSYKADNRLVYFDNNDFDEACSRGRNLYELVRLLTSGWSAPPTSS